MAQWSIANTKKWWRSSVLQTYVSAQACLRLRIQSTKPLATRKKIRTTSLYTISTREIKTSQSLLHKRFNFWKMKAQTISLGALMWCACVVYLAKGRKLVLRWKFRKNKFVFFWDFHKSKWDRVNNIWFEKNSWKISNPDTKAWKGYI
jgi:hypothetical protein